MTRGASEFGICGKNLSSRSNAEVGGRRNVADTPRVQGRGQRFQRGFVRIPALGLCGIILVMGCESSSIRAAKQSVAALSRDPGSVQFREVRTGYRSNVCGEFNAQNAYSGYVGFEPFIVDSARTITVISAGQLPVDQDLIAVSCIPEGPTRDSLVDLAFTAAADAMDRLPLEEFTEAAKKKIALYKAWKREATSAR